MISQSAIDNAKEHFATIINEQVARVEAVKNEGAPVDYGSISPVVIGIIGGDGIGPAITEVGRQVLEELLSDEVAAGKSRIPEYRRADDRESRGPHAIDPRRRARGHQVLPRHAQGTYDNP